jgi:predicted glycoside hydrolase/deacetylase ChbG (UPF0249 family)
MAPAEKRVVIHADDLGASHGANAAFVELAGLGVCTSGSVMVPCPWFPEVVAMAKADPSLDIGVHLTLTSEMTHYKWRPLTTPPAAAGLTDANGYFLADVATLRTKAQPDAVEAELRAQIDMALASGLDVTHLDDHAGAVLAPEFRAIYLRLGIDYKLPILVTPSLTTYGGIHNLEGVEDDAYRTWAADVARHGFQLFDRILETPWQRRGPAEAAYRDMIGQIGPGLNFMAMHFTRPGEIEAIDLDCSHIRTAEYDLFRSDAFGAWLHRQDVVLIGMAGLRDALRLEA